MNSANSRYLIEHSEETLNASEVAFINHNVDYDMSNILRDYLVGEDKEEGIQNEETILMDILSDEKEEVPPFCAWNPTLLFFDSLETRARPLKKATAKALIAGNVHAGLELVRRNPWLIREEMEGTVVMGERSITLQGKPLQILARLGDLNPIELEKKEKPIGGVEQLIALDLLTADEIENQFNEVFPPGSDCEDRMNPFKTAVEDLVSEIEALDIHHNAPWDEIRPLAEDIVRRFRATIFNLPQPEFGFVFDQRIFPWFIDRFWGDDGKRGWGERLGDEWSTKSDLLLVVGLGSLQAADTACGLQMHRRGVYNVVAEKEIPDRTLHFSASLPAFYSDLGSSVFLSLYGGLDRTGGALWDPATVQEWPRFYSQMLSNKSGSLAKIYADIHATPESGALCNPVNRC